MDQQKNTKIDTEPICETIENAAEVLERAAKDLRHHAELIRQDNDVTWAGEAVNTITNTFNNLRLDLFVKRSVRAIVRSQEVR